MSGNSSDPSQPAESLAGHVERVTFKNEENGFCVLRVKARGIKDLVTVVGHAAAISAGEWIQASGHWRNDKSYGQQFQAKALKASEPNSLAGIEKYLGSGFIKGVGPVYASKLVGEFGDKVLEVIESEPAKLRKVDGIGPKRAEMISKSWSEQKAVREIMLFLHEHGVGSSRAVKIFKAYGAESIDVMRANPYRLARDIRGIGFKTADQIATRLGFGKTAPERIRAGISHALSEATKDGHCAVPKADLFELCSKLLEVPSGLAEEALEAELLEGTVICDSIDGTDCVFLASLYHSERGAAEKLLALLRGKLPWPQIDPQKAIPWAERQTGLAFSQSQKEAIGKALSSKVMVITGGPGVGKTTLVNAILRILAAKNVRILLCAPTGRAARRLSESTGLEAKTIHRLLEISAKNGKFSRNEHNPLECDLLVLDETSMVDVALMCSLLRALPNSSSALFVGDIDQLPSVGPGQVLSDIIESGAIPVVRLVEVFRQAAQSRIITNAHLINQGRHPDLSNQGGESDFYFVPSDEPEDCAAKILGMVKNRIPRRFGLDPVRDVQILCPMNRGKIGAIALNSELQAALNPNQSQRIEKFGRAFIQGDKIMQIENDYDKEVYNGDIGYISMIDLEGSEVAASFDGRAVTYSFDDLDSIVPAYATTIHKSQGSEYPAVVIPVMMSHYIMLQRNLLYTGITRGRRLVVLVGQKKAVSAAIGNFSVKARLSKLRHRIEGIS